MKFVNKIMAFVLILVLVLTGLPSEIRTYAAEAITLSIEYNPAAYKYEISYNTLTAPSYTVVRYHNPDGSETVLTGQEVFDNGKVIVSTEFLPDHIYDISMDVYRAGDGLLSHQGQVYYLAGMTFTGESFNIMAKMADIEDADPFLDPDIPGSAIIVKSGDNPKMRLNWKIPTIYSSDEGIINLTDDTALSLLQETGTPISKACFQISMTVGHGSTRTLDFNTDYDQDKNMIIEGKGVQVSGFSEGDVTGADNTVSVILEKEHGIEPGTEYEFTNIGVIFENDQNEQVAVRRTKLRTDSGNRFMVRNIDNAFKDIGINLSSIFTPMQMEITKADTDKVEVRFRKITNGVYPELFYQVQYAPRIDDLYTQTEKWVKIPASALPPSEDYGSEIVTIDVPGTTNPQIFFRVVYFDSSSELPRSSSLCIDLSLLGIDSGKPPLPREIKAETVYAGRETVTLPTTGLSSGQTVIPLSDLRLSFEKPLTWKLEPDWDAFKAQPYQDSDFTFHILLSSYMPEADPGAQTKIIGDPAREIYLPVNQKRVLVLGKKDFIEDPADSNRLICVIPGDNLFHDYVGNTSIINENNEDPSEDRIEGDYPTFLVPNTTYYMQIFSSRLEDNDDIYEDLWGDTEGLADELNSRISYKSPIISFTTWPLTEMPVPMPDIKLEIEPETYVDPVTGNMTLEGIRVNYNRILTELEWLRYTSEADGREIHYEIFLSRDANVFDERPIATDIAVYPDDAEIIPRSVKLSVDGNGDPILPNTVYYVKARSTLVVGGEIIGRSAETAVKAITTPKIDSGGMEIDPREPRAPSEFSIAVDENGELLLSDAWVTLNWLHAEDDVTYEMVCTTKDIPDRDEDGNPPYGNDPYNLDFLRVYGDFRDPSNDNKLHLDVESPELAVEGLVLSENGRVLLPIRRDFLRPNRIYFFSLRAVRNRGLVNDDGESIEKSSIWITIPVTTRMVKAPGFLEAVKDMEIGFNIECDEIGTAPDSMEVYLKKAQAGDDKYILLNRAQYSCVQDGTTFYFRIYNLESDQWYDIKIRNKAGDLWYDNQSGYWTSGQGSPVKMKTRDGLREIEVRWEGEDPYQYFLEVRTDNDADYEKLVYNAVGFTDYGYDLPSGVRIMFYREKTKLYVDEGSHKFIYYAKISGKPVRNSDGSLSRLPLKTNTLYYVKLWAFNLEESLHIGPVSARTDFSQSDYDDRKKEDDTIDLFENEAEGLLQKLYWLVDIKEGTAVRAIIKDDRVSGLLRAARESTITVDISSEQKDASYYEILIPAKTLEAIEAYNSRLNLKLLGAEITLNKGSIDLEAIKAQALSNGGKEAMLLLKIERLRKPKTPLPDGYTPASMVYHLTASGVGSRLTYSEMNNIIYDILNTPEASGPFNYGILDRELSNVLRNLESYSYKSHIDLKDLIRQVIGKVEAELSRYLKDIIDGGSGYPKNFTVTKGISEFPERIGIKLEYGYRTGFITPYVNYAPASGWKEPAGGKAYVMQVVLFRAEKPGEYAVVGAGGITAQPGTPSDDAISRLSSRYDLTKVFGKGTIYPADPIMGEQAVTLYAVVTRRENEIMGMTPVQRASRLGIGDIMGAKQLTGYMDNQTSVSLAVKLYCSKANISPEYLKPSRAVYIGNGSDIRDKLYPYVILGIDLDLADAENNYFDALGRTSIGKMLDMISKVLEKFE